MINYGELEDLVLFGLEESLNYGNEVNDDCWFTNDYGESFGDYQGECIAEALYAKLMGWV